MLLGYCNCVLGLIPVNWALNEAIASPTPFCALCSCQLKGGTTQIAGNYFKLLAPTLKMGGNWKATDGEPKDKKTGHVLVAFPVGLDHTVRNRLSVYWLAGIRMWSRCAVPGLLPLLPYERASLPTVLLHSACPQVFPSPLPY